MTKERAGCPVILKGVSTDQGIVDAVVSVFNNIDSVGDRILPGAFAKSIANKLPKIVWMHDWSQPVGKTIEATELDAGHNDLPAEIKSLGGLRLKMQFNMETQRGRDAFSDIKNGLIDEFSIGFSIDKERDAGGVREIEEVTLYEASPVLFGANPETRLIGTKSGLNEHIGAVGGEVSAMVDRVIDRETVREKEGRTLSSQNVQEIEGTIETMQSGIDKLRGVLERAKAKRGDSSSEKAHIERERMRELLRIQGIIK